MVSILCRNSLTNDMRLWKQHFQTRDVSCYTLWSNKQNLTDGMTFRPKDNIARINMSIYVGEGKMVNNYPMIMQCYLGYCLLQPPDCLGDLALDNNMEALLIILLRSSLASHFIELSRQTQMKLHVIYLLNTWFTLLCEFTTHSFLRS